MSEVILKNIHKSYSKGSNAVTNVSFEIKDKEFVVLVGPSGCGKTTILRMVAGLEEISEGEIFIDGKLVNKIPPKERDIAMVFQNYALYPHMTVFENMAFALKLRGHDKSEIKRKVEGAAEILGLSGYLNRKPKELSGGQRQRTALGRAIVREPKVFLFDEPLSNLDAKLRIQMRTEISRLHKELGATIIYVTHDQVEAMTMGSKIVILNEGKIQQIGSPLEVYNKPANKFTAGFIGTPPMNFIQGSLQKNNNFSFVSKSGLLNIPININQYNALHDYADKNIFLGIRPEDIIITSGSDSDKNDAGIKIDLVEPLGSQTLLYFTIEGKTTVAEIHGNHDLKKDQLISIKFNSSKLHFFDYQNGVKL